MVIGATGSTPTPGPSPTPPPTPAQQLASDLAQIEKLYINNPLTDQDVSEIQALSSNAQTILGMLLQSAPLGDRAGIQQAIDAYQDLSNKAPQLQQALAENSFPNIEQIMGAMSDDMSVINSTMLPTAKPVHG